MDNEAGVKWGEGGCVIGGFGDVAVGYGSEGHISHVT